MCLIMNFLASTLFSHLNDIDTWEDGVSRKMTGKNRIVEIDYNIKFQFIGRFLEFIWRKIKHGFYQQRVSCHNWQQDDNYLYRKIPRCVLQWQ